MRIDCRCGKKLTGRWRRRHDTGPNRQASSVVAPRSPDGRRCTRSIPQSGRSRELPHWPCVPMDLPGRRYLCARCRTAVLICSPCDRGHRYCTTQCAKQARDQSVRAAGHRYQVSLRGRHAHAERQRRYRARQKKVTHQSSPPPAPPDQLPPGPTVPVIPAPWHCWRCRHWLPEFVRQDFLRRRIRRNRLHRSMHGPHPRN